MARGFASCTGCGRHVRGGDSACPFCGAAITAPARGIADMPGPRMSRAAILAGAAIMVGCSSSDPTPTTTQTDAASPVDAALDGPVAEPAYGAPILNDGGMAQPVYGAPVNPVDAGTGTGDDGGPIAQPVYGGSVPLDGSM